MLFRSPNGEMFQVQLQGSKKQTEEHAASIALKLLQLVKPTEMPISNTMPMSLCSPAVFVDCDNIGWVDANICSRFPNVHFIFYVSFHRNMPAVQNTARMCQNTTVCEAPHPGSDVCDVMILFDVFSYVEKFTKSGHSPKAIIVSGDKLLYNAQLLLSPHVVYLGSPNALLSALSPAS